MKKVETDKAPKAIGPYSQAVEAGSFVFCSGQIALDPTSGELVAGGIAKETERVLESLKAVLASAGCALDSVVSTTIYITDMNDFTEVNEIYGRYFSHEPKPARATVAVAQLPKGALVEISCVAVKK